jgi:mono/diheme cytochrome c family protein
MKPEKPFLIMNTLKTSLLAAIAFWVIGCGGPPAPNSVVNSSAPQPLATATVPAAPVDLLANGRKLYSDNCAACHKEDGTGGKMTIEGKSMNVDNLTSEKIKKFTDDKIIGYIYNGIEDEGMPAFKDELSEAEIREVVRYVRVGIQKMPEDSSAR